MQFLACLICVFQLTYTQAVLYLNIVEFNFLSEILKIQFQGLRYGFLLYRPPGW